MKENIEKATAGIRDMIEATRKCQEAIRQMESLTRPKMNNLEEIPDLYKKLANFHPGVERQNRRQFIMIVLYFYAPASLVGKSIPFKIKSALAKLFGVTVRNVEYIARDVLFMYDHYPDFREGVDSGIEFLLNKKAE